MFPESSEIYNYTNKTTIASEPRFSGAVVLEKPSTNSADYQLQIAYRLYNRKTAVKSGPKVNLVFHHGNGMNKGIWHYQIDQWFNILPNLDSVLAVDCVSHGQSAKLNRGKLGYAVSWIDIAKDVIKVVKYDEKDIFLQPNVVNIFVGHSLGGMVSFITAYFEPTLFDAIVPLNPVAQVDQDRADLLSMVFQRWQETEKISNRYPVEKGETYEDAVWRYYKTKSFFKKFDDKILQNMLEDDYTDERSIKHGFAYTNTDAQQEFLLYFGGSPSIARIQGIYDQITTPVYHIVGEFDTAGDTAVEAIRIDYKSQLLKRHFEEGFLSYKL
ncbi:hypothetical protein PSN45_002958 [Yamadazyma tenuis]|uniref:uncharacterized protein n=1 Tax=Candida tenuis TaxID=2315449 RepID=UPI00279A6430|nr:hypothetical protein PSN45_002958 [Yamadazyma tenuis]